LGVNNILIKWNKTAPRRGVYRKILTPPVWDFGIKNHQARCAELLTE